MVNQDIQYIKKLGSREVQYIQLVEKGERISNIEELMDFAVIVKNQGNLWNSSLKAME